MKTITKQLRQIFLLAILCTTISIAKAQKNEDLNYKTAIGGRFGYALAPSIKTFVSDKAAIEVTAFFREFWLQTNALYLIHNDIEGAPGLKYYYGGGGNIILYKNDYIGGGTYFGVVAAAGLDYKFKTLPLNLSIDYQPYFGLTGGIGFYGSSWGGLAVRYVLK